MYKISVVVTTYNRKYEVRRALDSVYAQTRKPYEVIVVDDGSNDGTEDYIKSFQFDGLKYCRLSVQSGPGAARNFGVKQASGDCIAFLDSDNEWYHTKLEEFHNVMETITEEWDIVYSNYMKHIGFESKVLPLKLLQLESSRQHEIWMQNLADASSSIYKKSFLMEVGLFSEELTTNIDWELLLRGSKKRVMHMQKIDKVLTENWTMFDGLTENKELERKERAKLFLEYSNDFFSTIIENNRVMEQQYIDGMRHCEEVELYYKALLERKTSFYGLLSKWMQLKLDGRSVAEYLRKLECTNIAIYGAGKHGKFLYQDLQNSEVKVAYFIDKNKEALQDINIVGYTPREELPEVDAIVVSTYMEFQEIKQELETICNYRLFTLNELVEW